jgi:hypothetical protein
MEKSDCPPWYVIFPSVTVVQKSNFSPLTERLGLCIPYNQSFVVYHYARIDPGSAFRLVVKVPKYVADGEYGLVDMAEQVHDLWLDMNCQYSLNQFHEDLATKIIWGRSQTLAV